MKKASKKATRINSFPTRESLIQIEKCASPSSYPFSTLWQIKICLAILGFLFKVPFDNFFLAHFPYCGKNQIIVMLVIRVIFCVLWWMRVVTLVGDIRQLCYYCDLLIDPTTHKKVGFFVFSIDRYNIAMYEHCTRNVGLFG